jgi:predicted acetyltransferase
MTITFESPHLRFLAQYAEALSRGWSPRTTRDVSGEQLAHIQRDAQDFIHELTRQEGFFSLGAGHQIPRIPSHTFWIFDGEFAGAIEFRFMRGTEDLPTVTAGHIGYAVVPWKRGRGYAKQALGHVLKVAREEGFSRVIVSCDRDNVASLRVIEANGGVLAPDIEKRSAVYAGKAIFWVPTL